MIQIIQMGEYKYLIFSWVRDFYIKFSNKLAPKNYKLAEN